LVKNTKQRVASFLETDHYFFLKNQLRGLSVEDGFRMGTGGQLEQQYFDGRCGKKTVCDIVWVLSLFFGQIVKLEHRFDNGTLFINRVHLRDWRSGEKDKSARVEFVH
jgi:hypothetical protein